MQNKFTRSTLRFDQKIWNWLKEEASKNKRSINGEIEYRLEQMRIAESK